MQVVNILLPVFVFISAGVFIKRSGFLSDAFFKEANKLIFYVGLPSFLFVKISSSSYSFEDTFKITLILILVMILTIVFAYLFVKYFTVLPEDVSAYVQIAFRGNTALIGLPIIAYSAIVLKDEVLLKNAVLSLAPAIPIWNMVSIILLNKDSVKTSTLDTRKAFIKQIILNPLVISCVLGLLFSVANIALPQFVEFSLTRLGQMTLPLALIAIGAGLQFRKNDNVKVAITSSIIKVFIAPVLALLLCWALGLSRTQIFTALIFCASPAAISIYVMTQELRGNYKLAGDGIVYSTVLSVIPLSAIIYFFC